MQKNKHLYQFSYHITGSDLCKLESRYLFNDEDTNKLLFSDVEVAPSCSAFIKNRLDIISSSDHYETLIDQIKNEKICIEGFKVEYFVFDGDSTPYNKRLEKLKDIGFSIEGIPDYYNPTVTYALCYHNEIWYFGRLTKNKFVWYKHKQKPRSYSSSISIDIAKALVNIATKANKNIKLLDACCGVGTIMLEACFAGHTIDGCDINPKICKNARENLAFFNYTAHVHHSDIKDIAHKYDAAIIDLPYNLLSNVTDEDVLHIIKSTTKVSDSLIIISTDDISALIKSVGFSVLDYCTVSKRGKSSFARKIWVCGKTNSLTG